MVKRRNIYLLIAVPVIVILSIIAVGLTNQVKNGDDKTDEPRVDNQPVVELVWEDGALKYRDIDNFDLFVEQASQPIFVDFWAAWCGPCRTAAPFVDSLAQTFNDQVHIVKIDVDHAQDLAMQYKVQSIPLFVMINDGEQVDQTIGYSPAMDDAITEMITRQIN